MKLDIRIKFKTHDKTKFLMKLNKANVYMSDISYEKDYLIISTTRTDLKKIKKYLPSYKYEIVSDLGIYELKSKLKKNSLLINSIIFGIILFILLSNIIVKVNIIHEDKEIREIIEYSLKQKGVTPLSFKKSYDEYETIIESIKDENKDKIEWLEIEVKGLVINIRVEERIINNYDKEYETCHVVASHAGVINSIVTEKGVPQVTMNSYVNKGDILISGEIKVGEEVKNNVCASGKVYAEVWYNVSATIPLEYEEIEYTGKNRYNFKVNDTVILKSRVDEKEVRDKKLISIFGVNLYLQKELEIKKIKKTYTEEEALKKAEEVIMEKLELKLDNFEEKLDEKVLKKSINNGNLYIDMFVSVKEQIGVREYFNVEMDSGTND